jgi:hypothetical protein
MLDAADARTKSQRRKGGKQQCAYALRNHRRIRPGPHRRDWCAAHAQSRAVPGSAPRHDRDFDGARAAADGPSREKHVRRDRRGKLGARFRGAAPIVDVPKGRSDGFDTRLASHGPLVRHASSIDVPTAHTWSRLRYACHHARLPHAWALQTRGIETLAPCASALPIGISISSGSRDERFVHGRIAIERKRFGQRLSNVHDDPATL